VAEEKVDWSAYFDSIKPVCPWSAAAWKKAEIKVTRWSGEWEHLDNNQAIVYIVPNYNRRRLKKLCSKLDTSLQYEWLWSDPKYGPYAAPMHILIQQDRRKLFDLRFNIGYYNHLLG
jgi:hypothetical protein